MNNPSSASLLINELITLYDDDNNLLERRERREGLITACVNYSRSPHARSIFKFLKENKATTQQELIKELHINKQTVSRHIRTLVDLGIIKITRKVGKPYQVGSGRPILIYIRVDADPSMADVARARLGKQIESEIATPARIQDPRDQQAETVNEWAARVEEMLPEGLETKLGLIYDAIREIRVPLDLKAQVKERVIDMRVKATGPVGAGGEEAAP